MLVIFGMYLMKLKIKMPYFQVLIRLKDIAVGSGFGLRYDFSFFVFRFDIGLKPMIRFTKIKTAGLMIIILEMPFTILV